MRYTLIEKMFSQYIYIMLLKLSYETMTVKIIKNVEIKVKIQLQ